MRGLDTENNLLTYCQSRLEFSLIYMLAYLWNKNLNKLDLPVKEEVCSLVLKPTIGDIVSLCHKLDIDGEFKEKKQTRKALDMYPRLRNQMIGHGYVYEDGLKDAIDKIDNLYNQLLESDHPIFKNDVDFVYITEVDDNIYRGINYKGDGMNFIPWSCPKDVVQLEVNCLYGSYKLNNYFRLSPFIVIDNFGSGLYSYNSIEEKLLGKYNKLLETGTTYLEWPEMVDLYIVNDGTKIKKANGTIQNIFTNNYTKYIDIGIKQKIFQFLTKDKSSVCATVWGHGGVGKTATVQSACDDLSNNISKIFDYIIFLSAKDRKYNFYTGNIELIDDRVSSYEEIINSVNIIVFGKESNNEVEIINFDGKLLLILDDYETFSREDQEKIGTLIQGLNINHHKVLITTRAANIKLGLEVQTSELSERDTIEFLLQVLENENLGNKTEFLQLLKDSDVREAIYAATNGRPLFIFQFAIIMAQKGLAYAKNIKINKQQSAINFLYDRIYDYLSSKAKDVFVVISLLVDANNLVNVIEKVQYVLNMENDIDGFYSAVNELSKLMILKFNDDEQKFFEVYSVEIYQIMTNYFEKRESSFKGRCISRLSQVNKDKKLDLEQSLLKSADFNRVSKNEIEVVDNYKQILNRATSPIEVKLTAMLNLASYLVIDKGKKDEALNYFDEYSHLFKSIHPKSAAREKYAQYTKMWATYNWSSGTNKQKEKAIEILLDYSRMGIRYDNSLDLELAGMILQYRSINLVSEWIALKDKRQYDEVSIQEFKTIRSKQKNICKDIYVKHGNPLYKAVCQIKLNEISSGARQNIVAGLYNYIDILIRMNMIDAALEICDYILSCAPANFHLQFKRKESWIKSLKK